MTESGGKATLAINNGSIDFPGVFAEPVVPFQRLSTELAWQHDGAQVQVQLNKLRFSNADADGELQLKWQTSDPRLASGGERFPGVLDMQGNLSRANATGCIAICRWWWIRRCAICARRGPGWHRPAA